MKTHWIKYAIIGIILTGLLIFSTIGIYNVVVIKVPLSVPDAPSAQFEINSSNRPVPIAQEITSNFTLKKEYVLQPSAHMIAKAAESIHRFTKSPLSNLTYSEANRESYADLYKFKSKNSAYTVNNVTGRVQSAVWFDMGSKDLKKIVNLDQGFTIAEAFAREKYPEFWNVSDVRDIKIMKKEVLDRGIDRELHYEWWEVYYAPDKKTLNHLEISGLNTISITVSPYTGHVTTYSEEYTLSVITGVPPVNLTPVLTEEQAGKIAKDLFLAGGVPESQLTGPVPFGLRISPDKNNTLHLVWTFGMIRTQQFERYGSVSIDAHDGTVIDLSPIQTDPLTNDQAWGYAWGYLHDRVGFTIFLPMEKQSRGIKEVTDEKGNQYPVWEFNIKQDPLPIIQNHTKEYEIFIDAYDGTIVWFAPFG